MVQFNLFTARIKIAAKRLLLFFLYVKNEKENLTQAARNDLRNDMGKLRKAISDLRGRNQ